MVFCFLKMTYSHKDNSSYIKIINRSEKKLDGLSVALDYEIIKLPYVLPKSRIQVNWVTEKKILTSAHLIYESNHRKSTGTVIPYWDGGLRTIEIEITILSVTNNEISYSAWSNLNVDDTCVDKINLRK